LLKGETIPGYLFSSSSGTNRQHEGLSRKPICGLDLLLPIKVAICHGMPFPYNLYDFKKNENMKSWKIYLYHKEVVMPMLIAVKKSTTTAISWFKAETNNGIAINPLIIRIT